MSKLILKFIRPNTVGIVREYEFDSYAEAEDTIERRCEFLADHSWRVSELKGSTSQSGTIECTHDDEADTYLINWDTE